MVAKPNLKFLAYLSNILYPNYDPYLFILYMLINYNRVRNLEPQFHIRIASNHFIQSVLKSSVIKDFHNTVLVDQSVLHKYIKFLTITCNDKVNKRNVHAIGVKLDDKNEVLVSCTLFHNLGGAGISFCNLKNYPETCWEYTDEVELSLINSPQDWSNAIVDKVLETYFATPKILYSGDIIEVNLKEYGREVFFLKNKIINLDESLYFRCTKLYCRGGQVKNGGYIGVIGQTTIKQGPNIQSFLPRNLQSTDPPLCPYGLEGNSMELRKAAEIFLIKGLNCKHYEGPQ